MFPVAVPNKSFAPNAVYFDGTNDYLTRAEALTGLSNGKQGTCSVWFRTTGLYESYFLQIGASFAAKRFRFAMNSAGQLYFNGFNSAGTRIMLVSASVGGYNDNKWHHFMGSYDLTDSNKRQIFIDGEQLTPTVTDFVNDNIEYSAAGIGVYGTSVGEYKGFGDVAEVWWTNTYMDLSVEANQRKFITAGGRPVNLGANGSRPTGTQPIVYIKGNTSAWNAGINLGSGGNFTTTGATTDSSYEPVRIRTSDYLADAVYFDGTNDVLDRTSLTGIADGKQFIASLWLRPDSTWTDASQYLFVMSDGTTMRMFLRYVYAGNTIALNARNAAGTNVYARSSTLTVTPNQWNNVLISFDLTDTNKNHLYINDVSDTGSTATFTDDTMDFTLNHYNIGARYDRLSGTRFAGDMAELYFTTSYLDLSVESNRRKFITSSGTPAYLGVNGAIPTGTAPILYMKGIAAVWNLGNNYGTGGYFTTTGAVTDSTNEPVRKT